THRKFIVMSYRLHFSPAHSHLTTLSLHDALPISTNTPFNGIKIVVKKVEILKPKTYLTNQKNSKMNAAGNKATNELETSGGTPSGILIVIFFSLKKR